MKMTLYINSGVCKCGCFWDQHHLGMIVNKSAYDALVAYMKENHPDYTVGDSWGHVTKYPAYIPQECDHYGCNEYGGMKYNDATDQYEYHCHGYEDKDGPLGEVEWNYT